MVVCTGAPSLTTADSSGAGTSGGRAAPRHMGHSYDWIWSNLTDFISTSDTTDIFEIILDFPA
ncbi:MAG TPA: hypothetical protein VJZ27_07280 [Aggregatilineales bacterium]|nr:hypothetical protein [Aggregatilineales bacterium]